MIVAVHCLLALTFAWLLWRGRKRRAPAPPRRGEILVDGSNVMHWQDDEPRLDTIRIVVEELIAKRLYREVVEQAVAAERLGYDGVSIPEHHLVNVLLIPSPLQMAVKIAAPQPPRLNEHIRDALPGSELVVLPGLKHAIFIEATEAVLPHVRRFLLSR